ncbi:hypothetical protein [Solimonas soli]|uniref:hypothetical protein n=1 Tax=Solimonas soli TaxID=413479 RepID=UPI0012FCD1F8|nr:hypothetical protein [Solimonas soli]
MSGTKIEVNLGPVSFSGEGDQTWLAEQLEKVLSAAPAVLGAQAPVTPPTPAAAPGAGAAADATFTTSLSSYIKEKGGESNQVDRFLITADWLRRRGVNKLTTAAVSKALTDNHQKRLANPADCLNKNVSKGLCEKADGGFYISPEGLKKLGHA